MPFRSSKGQDPSVQNLIRTQGSSNLGQSLSGGAGGSAPAAPIYTFEIISGPGPEQGQTIDLATQDNYQYVFSGPGTYTIRSLYNFSVNIEAIGGGGGGGGIDTKDTGPAGVGGIGGVTELVGGDIGLAQCFGGGGGGSGSYNGSPLFTGVRGFTDVSSSPLTWEESDGDLGARGQINSSSVSIAGSPSWSEVRSNPANRYIVWPTKTVGGGTGAPGRIENPTNSSKNGYGGTQGGRISASDVPITANTLYTFTVGDGNPGGPGTGGSGTPGYNGAVGIQIHRFLEATQTAASAGFAAGGGNHVREPGNGYRYHTFTSPGTFNITQDKVVEVLVVAGGGAVRQSSPPSSQGAGAGGGGVVYATNLDLTTGSFNVTVGSGGDGNPSGGSLNGGNSVFGSLMTALGGGGYGGTSGSSGGSGAGGKAGGNPAPTGNQPGVSQSVPGNTTLNQYGNPGGTGVSSPADSSGGGGGGSAGPGGNGFPSPNNRPGSGGGGQQFPGFNGNSIGLPSINPYSGRFGGGGGAAPTAGTNPGGGGNNQGGVDYTGGGAGWKDTPSTVFNNGGDGIVVVRYLI